MPLFCCCVDAQYELAKVIKNLPIKIKDENHPEIKEPPVTMTNDPRFCVKKGEGTQNCATWLKHENCKATLDEVKIMAEHTLFAVKTCKKYHSEV